ncbi:MAG: caspase family protein, partial [Xenococcaceae cyanobacterium]
MTAHWEAQVIGINAYPPSELGSLTVAANDAEKIAQRLEESGYETFRVQRLPQSPNQKGEGKINPEAGVSHIELRNAIANLFTPESPNQPPETALFFFSGHGWKQTVNGKEEVFLATSDVLSAHPDASQKVYGIEISWLGKQIQESKAKRVIVWLDCCYGGELFKYLPTNKDYCLITATRTFEPGKEIVHEQGLLTKALLEGLNPEKHPDEIVDSHYLASFVEKRMEQWQTSQLPQCANSKRTIPLTSKFPKKPFQDKCPYRSLDYFKATKEDADVFYGRRKLTQQLIERVKENKRLIAVFGASGSGKSSLLRAGLFYQLRLGEAIAGSNNWIYIKPFTPKENPLQSLSEAVHNADILKNAATQTKSVYEDLVSLDSQRLDSRIILIIDQFEECFTMSNESNRKEFLDCLKDLINNTANLQIIIGMRSDFRQRLREYPEFAKKMSKVNVEHLTREEIKEAIEKPAEVVGLGIGEGLKRQLINDVEDYPGSLPLLQYTLTELWHEARRQEEQFLRYQTYEKLGGIEGTLGKRADEVFESLSKEEQTVAQRIFLELTQVGDAFDTRRRGRLGELENSHHSLELLDEVTQTLANEENRLITRTEPDEEISQETEKSSQSKILIDVVHEALIRHWQQLLHWKDEYRNGMVIERKIEAAAKEWEKNNKKQEYLLQGARLAEAEGYLEDYGSLGMLDGMAEAYIEASIQQEEARIQQEKNNRLRRRLVIGGFIGVVTLGAIVSTIFGLKSQRQATIATLKEQAATVKVLLPLEPLEPLVLAIATAGKNLSSWQVKYILPEVESSLYEAIDVVRQRKSFEGHESSVYAVAFSPDGQKILSGSTDNTLKLWDISGKLLHTFKGHESSVNAVAFSSDGQKILSGSTDNTLKLWRRGLKDLLEVGCERLRLHPVFLSPPSEDVQGEDKIQAEIAQGAAQTCFNYGGWKGKEKAEFLARQGLAMAQQKGDMKEAKDKFKQAKKLDSEVNLAELEGEAGKLAVPTLLKKGTALAREGKVSEAIAALSEAQKLKPDIDLNPDTKAIDKDPKAVGQQLAALTKVKEGVELAREGKVEEAIAAYQEAQKLKPGIDLNPDTEA